jgi:transposase
MEIRAGKRFRSKQERRQIVEETLKPGASVSRVARAHDVNSNQVFQWRRQYRAGLFDEVAPSSALVPVTIATAANKRVERTRGTSSKAAGSGTTRIEIDLGHARVRIEGADAECVRAALEGLLR